MKKISKFLFLAFSTFTISNNTFYNNGAAGYPESHGATRFAKYVGAADGVSEIIMTGNTVDNSYMLLRIDATSGRTAITQPVHANNNTIKNNNSPYIVRNENAYNVDANNNTYDKELTDEMLKNVTWK